MTRIASAKFYLALAASLFSASTLANPYPDPKKVPRDQVKRLPPAETVVLDAGELRRLAPEVLRVRVDWDASSDSFRIGETFREASGTPTLALRASKLDPLGSFRARLVDPATGNVLAYDSIGTGTLYRKLVRALSFRFPLPAATVRFDLLAEEPKTGVQVVALSQEIDPRRATSQVAPAIAPEVRLLKASATGQGLLLNIYSEGYTPAAKERFWVDARKAVQSLQDGKFPGLSQMEIRAVFSPSTESLGDAVALGTPVPERNSYLGLYYPYWENFGRWYHVVYPTREERYRAAIGQVPYDYPLVLVDSSSYWGVGNYKEYTAIPARSIYFSYLLFHEMGHFFGLNEEYEGGGRTELEFAPGIEEPWSQNITFLKSPSHSSLKWNSFVAASTPLPTPVGIWTTSNPKYGAYLGGYADSLPEGHSHKPGLSCVMESGGGFCPICTSAIETVVKRDQGL